MSHSRTLKQHNDQALIEGIRNELAAMPVLYLGGQTFTPQSLVARIQCRIDAIDRVAAARAAWLKAVGDYEALDPEVNLLAYDLKAQVKAMFGARSEKLGAFGFTPTAIVVRTDEQKAIAAERARATRKARGTVGARARLALTATAPVAPEAGLGDGDHEVVGAVAEPQ